MDELTDADLEALLRMTFSDAESQVDADRAIRLAVAVLPGRRGTDGVPSAASDEAPTGVTTEVPRPALEATRRRRPGGGHWLLVAAAVLCVVAVVGAFLLLRTPTTTRPSGDAPRPTSSATSTAQGQDPRAETTRAVEGLLDAIHLPSGATRLSGIPLSALQGAQWLDAPTGPHAVIRTRAYAVHGLTVAQVQDYLRVHANVALQAAGADGTGVPPVTSTAEVHRIGWASAGPLTDVTAVPWVVVSTAQDPTGVYVRVDAAAYWVPPVPAAARITGRVESTTVTLEAVDGEHNLAGIPASGRWTTRLSSSAAQVLVKAVNGLGAASDADLPCRDNSAFGASFTTTRMTVRTSVHTYLLRADASCPPRVTVTVDGKELTPRLLADPSFLDAIPTPPNAGG